MAFVPSVLKSGIWNLQCGIYLAGFFFRKSSVNSTVLT